MRAHRGLIALCLASISLSTGIASVSAQTEVEDAERRAQQAAAESDAAYEIVTAAIANRDAIEGQLAEVLDSYAEAAIRLDEASRSLERIGQSLAFADAQAVGAGEQLAQQTVAAYMESVVTSSALVLDTESLEDALVVEDVFGRAQEEVLGQLDRLLIQQARLTELRSDYQVERDEVAELEAQLSTRSQELQALFASANSEVSAAFSRAADADAAYRSAVSDVDRARAAEEAARRATTTTTTTTPGQTTTTTAPGNTPPRNLGPAVEAWRPLVTQHFASDLVEDAMVIMRCESLGDPNAVNPYSGASGLFQFMPGTWAVASVQAGVGDRSVFDGEANIIAASWLAEYYRSRGQDPWRPWVCRSYL